MSKFSGVTMCFRILLLFVAAMSLPSTESMADHAPIVIIHGAWGGAHHWKAIDDSLTHEHGRTVRRASLTGLGERSHLASRSVNLSTHIRDVVNLIEFDDLNSVVLIAHSYGGIVAQGVVEKIPDRINQVIYIDSHLLDDGECYFTHHSELREKLTGRANEAGDGYLIPVDWENPMRDTPHPLATLVQPIQLDRAVQDRVAASYWLLADGKTPQQDTRYRYYECALDRGLTTKVFPWNHNPQRDRPSDLVREIVAVLDE
ncbi:MAG: alpha/beta hydrolase [Pirellulaceae bacterium]|nr:alpha/beta hydrolase [Pirellulaceae bacterium]